MGRVDGTGEEVAAKRLRRTLMEKHDELVKRRAVAVIELGRRGVLLSFHRHENLREAKEQVHCLARNVSEAGLID
ncbi:hypothetical protein ACFX11_046813 [Malus domestica]